MFDSLPTENRNQRPWIWFVGGAAVYLFILLNVIFQTVCCNISQTTIAVLAPGITMTFSDKPLLPILGVLLTLAIVILSGLLGLVLRRTLQIIGLLQ